MTEKLTKVEERWRRIVRRLWGSDATGWTYPSDRITTADFAILERRVKAFHVERDEYGCVRLTNLGREAIGLERIDMEPDRPAGLSALAEQEKADA